MNKNNAAVILAGICSIFAVQAQAEDSGWVIGPAFEEGWEPKFTLSYGIGYLDPDESSLGDQDAAHGIQLALHCPWFSPPKGIIRQQFNYNYYKDGGLHIRSFEINPRYYLDVSPGVVAGLGPGFGYVLADADVGDDADVWAFQLGADVEYRRGVFFLGLSTRYQWTENDAVGLTDDGADNLLTMLRIGVNM